MEPFTTTTLLTKKDYTKYLYKTLYKKPYYISATMLGIYFLATGIADAFANKFNGGVFSMELLAGFFCLLIPTVNILIARKNTFANPAIQKPITYQFSDAGIVIKGDTFDGNFTWPHIINLKEEGGFLLLFVNRKTANFIKTDGLTAEQIDFIKSKVVKKLN